MEEVYSPDGLQLVTIEAAGVTNEFVIPAYRPVAVGADGAAEEPVAELVAAESVTSSARGAHWRKLKRKKQRPISVHCDAESGVVSGLSEGSGSAKVSYGGASGTTPMSQRSKGSLERQHVADCEIRVLRATLEAERAAMEAASAEERAREEARVAALGLALRLARQLLQA